MVYVVQGTLSPRIKIGKHNPLTGFRLDSKGKMNSLKRYLSSTLQARCSDDLILRAIIPHEVDDRPYCVRFHHYTAYGEWFHPAPEILDWIATLTQINQPIHHPKLQKGRLRSPLVSPLVSTISRPSGLVVQLFRDKSSGRATD